MKVKTHTIDLLEHMLSNHKVTFDTAVFSLLVASLNVDDGDDESNKILMEAHKRFLELEIGSDIVYIDIEKHQPIINGVYHSSDLNEGDSYHFTYENGKYFVEGKEIKAPYHWSFL